MKILLQLGFVLTLCLVCELISSWLPFAFPVSVLAMILLFVLLCSKLIKPHHIEKTSGFFLQNMAFFFVPAGVEIISYYDMVKDSVWQLILICLLTLVFTFAATAYTVRFVCWLQITWKKRRGNG